MSPWQGPVRDHTETSVSLSLVGGGQKHPGDPDAQPADAERAGERANQPLPVQPPAPRNLDLPSFPSPLPALVLLPYSQGLSVTGGIMPQHPPPAVQLSIPVPLPPQPQQHRGSLAGARAATLHTQD